MAKVEDLIKTATPVVPMIYAYTTPEIVRHNGWTKIGYTEQNVDKRLEQQMHTADVRYKLEWKGNAVYDDGSGDVFKDTDFHAYLKKKGIERTEGTEWFHITGSASHDEFNAFRENHGIVKELGTVPYALRSEQADAVRDTAAYIKDYPEKEYLWNAKPRFGKTLSTYDLIKRIDCTNVLIVTQRPVIATSWYDDYAKFLGTESGYLFVSTVDSIKNMPLCLNREQYLERVNVDENVKGCIEFVSMQDLKGSRFAGGQYDKLSELFFRHDDDGNEYGIYWDLLVIDEAHEGVDTYKTDLAFDHIKRHFTLHLSGTPFKAIANEKFPDRAIFNWTYADEQKKKAEWTGEDKNPYADLPRLNLFTYQMSEIIKDQLRQGIEINGETKEYAFDLNEFFETNSQGAFVHNDSVDEFLDAMTKQEKYPFSTPSLRNELRHTLWILDRVASAKALAKKLENHSVFKDYAVVLAAGDGQIDEDAIDDATRQKAIEKVRTAIHDNEKTITLSVGQLTTGVTIPEWTAVLMLSNMKSPSLYMQSAFRAQNPCLFYDKVVRKYSRKGNAYVFDFDPARTLDIFEKFANDLSEDTVNGNGDLDIRKQHVRNLLNFFPVIGEDDEGRMIELDAEKVLSIPRKIRCQEVVRRGFMSNFLFQNITNIFNAPQEVLDILNQLPAMPEGREVLPQPEDGERLNLNEDGEVEIPAEEISNEADSLFGPKIYDDIEEDVAATLAEIHRELQEEPEKSDEQKTIEHWKESLVNQAVTPLIDAAKTEYGSDLRPGDQRLLGNRLKEYANRTVQKTFDNANIKRRELDFQKQQELSTLADTHDKKAIEAVHEKFKQKQDEITENLTAELAQVAKDFMKNSGEEIVETVRKGQKEHERDAFMEGIRERLRGFSRTIPSFLMAYSRDNEITLENFDVIVPDEVFKEVTSISINQFRLLRDGGDYEDKETKEQKHFDGHLFDPVVFDDSVKEFLRKKEELADYFDEEQKEDIFDYIPPQKTNQIYTPKQVVKQMVDLLEKENPGCFDQPDKTFVDLYMKSGLYITEIVKRLYNSKGLKAAYPDENERLDHIFAKQVYGLAPTEIIYRIATAYILGFEKNVKLSKTNFCCCDSLHYAEEGTLENKLEELFPEMKD